MKIDAKRRERLETLLDPAKTAVVTMELQRGVVGPEALMPVLSEQVAKAGTLVAAARVCASARGVGARVVHCTLEARADGAGATENCAIFAKSEKLRRQEGILPTAIGSEGARLVEPLGDDPRDIVLPRMHGMTPFTSTSLDQMLRNLGIRTIVATGVSVNLGVLGMCLSALDLGYHIVLPRDAVAGVPPEYADAVIDHTLSLITTLSDSEEIASIWPG